MVSGEGELALSLTPPLTLVTRSTDSRKTTPKREARTSVEVGERAESWSRSNMYR